MSTKSSYFSLSCVIVCAGLLEFAFFTPITPTQYSFNIMHLCSKFIKRNHTRREYINKKRFYFVLQTQKTATECSVYILCVNPVPYLARVIWFVKLICIGQYYKIERISLSQSTTIVYFDHMT